MPTVCCVLGIQGIIMLGAYPQEPVRQHKTSERIILWLLHWNLYQIICHLTIQTLWRQWLLLPSAAAHMVLSEHSRCQPAAWLEVNQRIHIPTSLSCTLWFPATHIGFTQSEAREQDSQLMLSAEKDGSGGANGEYPVPLSTVLSSCSKNNQEAINREVYK